MAVHEITEHPDGSAEEWHSFSAEEWDRFASWLQRDGSHAHPDLEDAALRWEADVRDREERNVQALSSVFAVAQWDPRFRLEAV